VVKRAVTTLAFFVTHLTQLLASDSGIGVGIDAIDAEELGHVLLAFFAFFTLLFFDVFAIICSTAMALVESYKFLLV